MDPLLGGLIGGGLTIVDSFLNQGANQANADANRNASLALIEAEKNKGTAIVSSQNLARIESDQNKTLAMYGLIAVGVAVLGFVAYGLVTK